ncbi:AraC family transcriptional regulator [Leifsonia poae]|uniref:AraC family transcriptional regulator n=1 Tax=Leifsonia poae TaxID=110933 RepID=A0A9W6H9V6_9MICO|nr:AraC family transcriptional regulator [Leifsonia poae]GLJ76595.1 AraC family transcriptional regulator [Leifsonia poae]
MTATSAATSAAASAATSAGPRSKGLLTPEDPGAPVRISRLWPGDAAACCVRHYWLPRWSLPAGESLRQEVLEYPTSNLVIEPEESSLHRARRGRSTRILAGEGWAFGVLLHPGVARGLAGVSVRTLPVSVPLSALPVPGTAELLTHVRDRMRDEDDSGAVEAFEAWLTAAVPPPGPDGPLVAEIVDAVENDRDIVRVEQLADRFGIGVRHLQRLIAGHIGFSPKWLIQRYRLQEAAAALRSDDAPPLAELASALGYADQAHFGREFKAVVGQTPGAYQSGAA